MSVGKLAITLPCPGLSSRDCVELAVKAEQEWGYEAIWLAEVSGPDSFSLAGAIAQATSRIEIGTAIVPVYNRTPVVLAMSAATLADLSGGRFKLGLGTSSHAITEEWNGIALKQPLGRTRETVTVLRQALGGHKTDLEGETLRSRGSGESTGVDVEELSVETEDSLLAQLRSFVEAVTTGARPAVSARDALGALRTAQRIVDAMPDPVAAR